MPLQAGPARGCLRAQPIISFKFPNNLPACLNLISSISVQIKRPSFNQNRINIKSNTAHQILFSFIFLNIGLFWSFDSVTWHLSNDIWAFCHMTIYHMAAKGFVSCIKEQWQQWAMSNVMWNIHNKMHIDVKMRKKYCLKFKSSNFMENNAKQIDETKTSWWLEFSLHNTSSLQSSWLVYSWPGKGCDAFAGRACKGLFASTTNHFIQVSKQFTSMFEFDFFNKCPNKKTIL